MNRPTPTHAELRQLLFSLHAELGATTRLDEASRRLLRELLGDIERLLGEPAGGRAGPAGTDTAPQRLEALAVEFENRHPLLAAGLRQLVDLLGRAGL